MNKPVELRDERRRRRLGGGRERCGCWIHGESFSGLRPAALPLPSKPWLVPGHREPSLPSRPSRGQDSWRAGASATDDSFSWMDGWVDGWVHDGGRLREPAHPPAQGMELPSSNLSPSLRLQTAPYVRTYGCGLSNIYILCTRHIRPLTVSWVGLPSGRPLTSRTHAPTHARTHSIVGAGRGEATSLSLGDLRGTWMKYPS